MPNLNKEQFFAEGRKQRKKLIALLNNVSYEHIPKSTPKRRTVAKSIAEHALSNAPILSFPETKRLNDWFQQGNNIDLEYIESFERFMAATRAVTGGLHEAVKTCGIPLSHIESAMNAFMYIENQCKERSVEFCNIENNKASVIGRALTREGKFTFAMNGLLNKYSFPRKRRARIIAALIIALNPTDQSQDKLASSIEQRIRNAEI